MKHAPLVFALALGATAPVLADEIDGTVLAFDRVANVLVMKDKSVIPLETFEGELPEDLVAGDKVAVRFDSNEDTGISMVHSVERLE